MKKTFSYICLMLTAVVMTACAQAERPGPRTPEIPAAQTPAERMHGINENNQGVLRIPLGGDVLVPVPLKNGALPNVYVGPYELRSETLASALQLILADFDVALAFENEEGLSRRVTIANLQGRLPDVIEKVCGLADLYCGYEEGLMTVKETETFVVDLPPVGESTDFSQIAGGLSSIVGEDPTVNEATRVLVYEASHRTQRYAEQYFKKLRKNTALIVFETHVWEVGLSNDNRTGINWTGLLDTGNFDFEVTVPGAAPTGTGSPITITPNFTGSADFSASSVLEFISTHGAVKTISQPQLTVLSGSEATLSVQQSENFVSEVSRTTDENGDDTFAVTTETVETGLTMTVQSAWDKSTVYGTLDISLDELLRIEDFSPSADTTIQLPETTTRSLQTQIRVRPGDAILIAGLVTERDNYDASGPGLLSPILDTSRGTSTENTELVFLLRPRVVAFVSEDDDDYKDVKNSFDQNHFDDQFVAEMFTDRSSANEVARKAEEELKFDIKENQTKQPQNNTTSNNAVPMGAISVQDLMPQPLVVDGRTQ